MNRRTLLVAGLGAVSVLVPSVKAAEGPFRKEEIDLFGHHVTQYTWPNDRPILMERDVRSIVSVLCRTGWVDHTQEGDSVFVPVLDTRECPLDKESIDMFVRACRSDMKVGAPDFSSHYLFRIEGYPTLYGLLGCPTPMRPITDHFAKDLARFEARLKKKGII
jgi:hypothetical protein